MTDTELKSECHSSSVTVTGEGEDRQVTCDTCGKQCETEGSPEATVEGADAGDTTANTTEATPEGEANTADSKPEGEGNGSEGGSEGGAAASEEAKTE